MANTKKTSKKVVKKKTTKKKVVKKETKKLVEKKEVKQKTKKKKQNPLKNKTNLIIIGIIIVAIIAFFVAFTISSNPCGLAKFNFTIQGIPYCSNTFTPTTFFAEFKQNDLVYVSPILDEVGAEQLTANAMNLWQIVLIGNDINAVQLIRVRTDAGISYCYTNKGDIKTAEQISIEECNTILNNPENAVVFIEEGREKVVMDGKKIYIYSSMNEVTSQVNFAVIKQIFPNAQTILSIVNEKIYGIN